MNLPPQSEPVERRPDITHDEVDRQTVTPQIECYCTNGQWSCLVNKQLVPTGIACA